MERNFGVLIVGCGYWGVNYVRVFDELPNVQVSVCDQRSERLQEIQNRFRNVTTTTDLQDILKSDEIDIAIVCTGAKTHHVVASACLKAGKHVLVEKPIATTVADAKEMIAIAQENDVILMVGHTFLYNSAVQKVDAVMTSEEQKQIYYLYSRRTNMGPIRPDVNAIWDLAPHDVSIFNHLLDSTPEWVSAVGIKALQNEREDAGFISLGYPNGIVGNIHVSWVDPNKVRELVVVSNSRRIIFDDLNSLEPVKVFEKGVTPTAPEASSFGEHQFLIRDGDIFSPKVEMSEPLKNQCLHLLWCIENNQQPLTDGQSGLDVVKVMAAVDLSLQRNGTPVFINTQAPLEEDESAYRNITLQPEFAC